MIAFAATWEIDPVHTTFQFSVRHMMVSNVKGIFHKFSGSLDIDAKYLTKTKESTVIDAASASKSVMRAEVW